ncbi:hypothetical protein F5J12DRAFT_785812 [Pisolithus orientalis]|uniref:uncharacterized protein n=1 Tax=Pisolithus orientalis TaxID=936130 RepID=UPI002224018C|nr:uncharacterized protein F5J12DRAFT_785812 [Pisolithus orientalis]KAI5994248.1 hypothetical protein F5J12DRAFT_785812 [Pisolithus orientalis]
MCLFWAKAQMHEKIDSMKHNLRLHIVPLVLVGKRPYGLAIQFEGGILGPISLFNTMDDIHQFYVRVLKEPEGCLTPREEGQASTVGIPPPTSGPSGGTPALQKWIADAPSGSTPVPNVGSTPTPTLIDHVAVQPHETQQVSELRPWLSSQAQSSTRTQPTHKAKGAKPSAGKSRALLKLGGSSLTKNRGTITGAKTGYWGHQAGQMTPTQRQILWLCAMSKGFSSTSAWHQFPGAIGLEMSGCKSAQSKALHIPGMYVNGIIANGGENNPQVMAKIKPLKKALAEPCPPSNVRSREWYECQAQAIGCTINQVPPGHMALWADDQQIVSAFASAAFIYDPPHCPHGGASTVRGNPPAKDSEPKEGKMTDDLFEDEDRS